ncbi:unnamed protein product, partial [Allacma fusca]
ETFLKGHLKTLNALKQAKITLTSFQEIRE